MANTSVAFTNIYNSISESIFNELLTNRSIFYTYISKTKEFSGSEGVAINSQNYENIVRNNIVYMKKININDISYVTQRIDWVADTVYDMYDDNYHGGGISNIIVNEQGSGYSPADTYAYAIGGGGRNYTLKPSISNGAVTSITIDSPGFDYISTPSIVIVGAGTGASATASISDIYTSHSGNSSLRKSPFYVMNSYYNVYKCIDNAGNSVSTVIPESTDVHQFTTSDGYIWKFMYYIPLVLRKKFLTPTLMPVTNVFTSSFFSNGGINNVIITNPGSGYSTNGYEEITVVGDGTGAILNATVSSTLREISDILITNSGKGYSSTTTKSIYSIEKTGSTLKVTTTSDHRLVEGSQITLSGTTSYDGTYIIITKDNKNAFTLSFTTAGTFAPITYYGIVNYTNLPSIMAISSIVVANNVATITTSTPHAYNENNIILVSGANASIADFDGSYKIVQYISPTVFSVVFYKQADVSVGSGGSIVLSSLGVSNLVRVSSTSKVTVTTSSTHNFFSPITAVTNIVLTANIITISSVAHGLHAGDSIVISNTTNYNGVYNITSVTNNTIVISKSSANLAAESSATISCKVTISNIAGFGGDYLVATVVNPTTITFTLAGADYSSYTNTAVTYNTGLFITKPSGATGKYSGNTGALLQPNILYNSGFDYSSTPTIIIQGTTGTGATASATRIGGSISSINVLTAGSGYTTPPKIYFNGGTSNAAAATVTVSAGKIDLNVTVSNQGIGYYSAPEILFFGGGGSGATATATISAGKIDSIVITNVGSNYTSAPTLYFTGTSDWCCAATPVLYKNTVSSIIINSIIDTVRIIDPGKGYAPGAAASVSIVGDGTGAVLTPYIKNGSIAGITVDSVGEGYSYAVLTISGSGTNASAIAAFNTTNTVGQLNTLQYENEILAIDGAIHTIKIISGGTGYVTGEVIYITGDGNDADAIITAVNGVITKITMRDVGYGYRSPTMNIITASGTGAILRPIIAPPGGHGKNAIKELFADNLMFYSKLSNVDSYKGYPIGSTFHQYGIFSSPTEYDTAKAVNTQIVSPCFDVAGAFSVGNFLVNATVKITKFGTDYLYVVVDVRSGGILLQQLSDNSYVPVLGDIILDGVISSTITEVNLPTTNKYNGELIDINNAIGFTKDAQQVIALRTLISI